MAEVKEEVKAVKKTTKKIPANKNIEFCLSLGYIF